MLRKITSIILMVLALTIVFGWTSNIQLFARAYSTYNTIFITGTGIVPPDAPLQKIGDLYVVIDDIASANDSYALVIERSNIVLDGAGHVLSGITGSGIYVVGEANVTIKNFTVTGFGCGIQLSDSSWSIICKNNIIANFAGEEIGSGIDLYSSSFNQISDNNITNNSGGISLYSSSDNVIVENNFAGNSFGIHISSSSNNRVYHNNFLDNTVQASFSESTTFWDNGYPSGGNYWSDNNGTDLYRGLYQNETGSDGIADSPYFIDETTQKDSYPLMGLFGGLTNTGENVIAFPQPNICFIFQDVTVAGSTAATPSTPPPPPTGYRLVGAYYEILITALYTGKITIRMTYDATGMTPSQESSLVLLRYDALATDVNKDSKVNLKDVLNVILALGTRAGTRRWNPACDVNHDGVVNSKDLLVVLRDFGKSAWTNITMFVDTANHQIYGVTTHFSGIGIHRLT